MKALLYCTKASPYLMEMTYYEILKKYGISEARKSLTGEKRFFVCKKVSDLLKEDQPENDYEYDEFKKEWKEASMNGSVCFECECKEAFVEEFQSGDCFGYYPPNRDILRRQRELGYMPYQEKSYITGLSGNEIDSYGEGNPIWLYHFENVKHIKPFPITELYRDGTMVYPLTRAPESYCFAYQKVETTKEGYLANVGKDESRYYLQENGKFFYSEKVLVFSIRSHWLCKIANGEKDLEVRKQRISNAGIEYK